MDLSFSSEVAAARAEGVPCHYFSDRRRVEIGLTPEKLDGLWQAKGVAKLSRADFAACLATGGTGATTVAATMIAAHAVGIEVFATGSIGGVHKSIKEPRRVLISRRIFMSWH